MAIRKATARWQGDLSSGKGEMNVLGGTHSYSFPSRFEEGDGTNPEELIGAAHASCFSMALGMMLEQEGVKNVKIETTCDISMDKEGDGFAVKKAHLTTTIASDADEAKVLEIAGKAKEGCPISKLLNAEITMDAKVA